MATLSTKQLTQRLHQLEQQELIDLVLNMCSRIREAKQYCQMEFGDMAQQAALLDAAKSKMYRHFFPTRRSRSHRPRTSRLRTMISDFKKIAVFPLHLAHLTLYWVELAVEYLAQNRNVKDSFYAPTEKAMENAATLIRDNALTDYFRPRLEALYSHAAQLHYHHWFKEHINASIREVLDEQES